MDTLALWEQEIANAPGFFERNFNDINFLMESIDMDYEYCERFSITEGVLDTIITKIKEFFKKLKEFFKKIIDKIKEFINSAKFKSAKKNGKNVSSEYQKLLDMSLNQQIIKPDESAVSAAKKAAANNESVESINEINEETHKSIAIKVTERILSMVATKYNGYFRYKIDDSLCESMMDCMLEDMNKFYDICISNKKIDELEYGSFGFAKLFNDESFKNYDDDLEKATKFLKKNTSISEKDFEKFTNPDKYESSIIFGWGHNVIEIAQNEHYKAITTYESLQDDCQTLVQNITRIEAKIDYSSNMSEQEYKYLSTLLKDMNYGHGLYSQYMQGVQNLTMIYVDIINAIHIAYSNEIEFKGKRSF